MNFVDSYISESKKILEKLNTSKIISMINTIQETRENNGRIFFLGVGGSAANASHAVNDFRKIVGIESYTPTDNVSELTANTNDCGWETIFVNWLKVSKLSKKDILFIFSVGGGNEKHNISTNLILAMKFAKEINSKILAIVGKKNGYAFKNADICLDIPIINENHVTPHSESFQSLIWHLIVTDPSLAINKTKWESTKNE